jgi:PEP-CTERM motif
MSKLIIPLLLGAAVLSASSITYDVDQMVGAGGVTGYIETDGATGVLGLGDVLDWNLTLNDGTTTFDLLGPLSGSNSTLDLQGSDLSATSTQLLFNFNDTAEGFVLFQSPSIGSKQDFWCPADANTVNTCAGQPAGESLQISPTGVDQFTGYSGTGVVIASVSTSAVPEPASIPFALAGLAGIFMAGRRRV